MGIELLLPADNATSGFDNIRDLLFVSPTQLEQYLSAARKISRIAVGDPQIPLIVDRYAMSAELPQDGQLEGAPFGTREVLSSTPTFRSTASTRSRLIFLAAAVGTSWRSESTENACSCSTSAKQVPPSSQSKPAVPVLDDTAKAVTSAASTGTAQIRARSAVGGPAGRGRGRQPDAASQGWDRGRFLRPLSGMQACAVKSSFGLPSGAARQPAISTLTIKGPGPSNRSRRHAEPPAHFRVPAREPVG